MSDSISWWSHISESGLSLLTTVLLGAYLSAWIDSKLGADLQARVGPNRVGWAGVLQPFAGFVRMLLKTNSTGTSSRVASFWWLQALPLFAMLALVPAGGRGPLLDAPLAVFVPIFLGLCFSWAGLLICWQSEKIEGRFESIRQAALTVSALPPTIISLSIAGLAAGGFSWTHIQDSQGILPIHWLAFSNPFTLLATIIFIAAGMLVFTLPPFSSAGGALLPLVASIPGNVGVREAWVRIGSRLGPLCWNLVAVQVFLGGSAIPSGLLEILGNGSPLVECLRVLLLVAKVQAIYLVISLLSRTLPSVRADQAHDFAWRVLSPAAILALAIMRLGAG